MRANGWTTFRLGVYWNDMEPERGRYDRAYIRRVQQVLDEADDAGVKVILDLHQDGYSAKVGGYGIPEWTTRTDGMTVPEVDPNDPDPLAARLSAAHQRAWQHLYEDPDLQQAQVDMWRTWVEALKDKPALLGYDLINEAFGEMRPGEGLVEFGQRVERTQLTAMQQRLTTAIRKDDDRHWIFVEPAYALTSTLAVPGGLGPIDDPAGRVVYAPHLYDLEMEAGGAWNPESDFLDRYWRNIVSYPKANKVPMVIGEWGPRPIDEPTTADFVRRVLQGVDEHSSGHLAWSWTKNGLKDWAPIDDHGDVQKGVKAVFAPYVMRIAGTPVSRVSRPAFAEVTLTDPTPDQVTVFYVPRDQFPKGPRVTGRGGAKLRTRYDRDTQLLRVQVTARRGGDGHQTITVTPQR